MEWFHSTEREQTERPKGGLASSHEIQSAFAEQRDYLYWIALLITGDDILAEQAVVNASDLSANYSSVFRDWLIGWAKYATVRAAVREVRDLISTSASYFADSSSEHCDDDVLSDDQIGSLRHIDPREIIAALDPLARSALVLRGIQHTSLADCALLLDVPRRIVATAYCQARRWNNERAGAQRAPNEDRVVSSTLITRWQKHNCTTNEEREPMQKVNETNTKIRMQHGKKGMVATDCYERDRSSSGRAFAIGRLCGLMLLVVATTASWAQVVSPNAGSVPSGPGHQRSSTPNAYRGYQPGGALQPRGDRERREYQGGSRPATAGAKLSPASGKCRDQ